MNNIYHNRLSEVPNDKSPLEGGIKFIPWNHMDIPLGGGSFNIKTLTIELTEPICRLRRLLPLRRGAKQDFLINKFFPPVTAKYYEAVRTSCKIRPAFALLRLGRPGGIGKISSKAAFHRAGPVELEKPAAKLHSTGQAE
ncbi:MAG: hypothetical protein K9N09_05090 [Candidatus Cloacimonetes bacterium]|nr:hypothetical protein [Candidatus Cloacimonadota bacterium]MCF7814038.1 hypothetical protein [Candidatus Cloacimonadota bacterium]MCF7868058.1 hypothetical protein [Candidatus Cloacimonadota bacterium]MCF7883481.1 hypothetical protein [Candidatus Cloacimonadota bacterium]